MPGLMKRLGSAADSVKPNDSSLVLRVRCQAREACLRPYSALFSLHARLGSPLLMGRRYSGARVFGVARRRVLYAVQVGMMLPVTQTVSGDDASMGGIWGSVAGALLNTAVASIGLGWSGEA